MKFPSAFSTQKTGLMRRGRCVMWCRRQGWTARALLAVWLLIAFAAQAQNGSGPLRETLNYVINWPSGLSLGEGQVTTQPGSGDSVSLEIKLEAALPGFPIEERASSRATANLCSIELEKKATRGKKKIDEKTSFDREKQVATRTTNNGGKSELQTGACGRDALAFLYYMRRELTAGRLPAGQHVFYGAAYDVRIEYGGAEKVVAGDTRFEADRLLLTIKGPSSESKAEIFFARDATRTPVLIRIPVALGTFRMELAP